MSTETNYTIERILNTARADYTNRVRNAKDARELYTFMKAHQSLFPCLDSYNDKHISYWLNCWIGSADLTIKTPWDTVLTDEVMNECIKLGWVLDHDTDYTKNYKEITYYLKHPDLEERNIRIVVNMNAETPGSKCKLVIDHMETREQPVYKVVCEDTINV